MSTENITVALDGKEIIIETGKMGRLADGACTITCGETTVMVTAVSQTKMRAVSYTHLTLPTKRIV